MKSIINKRIKVFPESGRKESITMGLSNMNRQTLFLLLNKCLSYAINLVIVLGILGFIIGFVYSMRLFMNS